MSDSRVLFDLVYLHPNNNNSIHKNLKTLIKTDYSKKIEAIILNQSEVHEDTKPMHESVKLKSVSSWSQEPKNCLLV